jgi:hypothetical protein
VADAEPLVPVADAEPLSPVADAEPFAFACTQATRPSLVRYIASAIVP